MPVRALTDANFDAQVLGSDIPVLVDFYGTRCAPCIKFAPIIDELAAELQGRFLVCKLATDTQKATATRFGVRIVPTLILFKNGKRVATHTGLTDKNGVRRFLGL